MARELIDLEINEVSVCVDPANEDSRISITKMVEPQKPSNGGQTMPEDPTLKDRVEQLAKEVEDLKKGKETAEAETKALKEELETRKSHESLTDDERKFYDTMKETEKTAFLKANTIERKAIMEATEVITTSDGDIIRKSDTDPQVFALLKAQREQNEKVANEVATLRKEAQLRDVRKDLETRFNGMPVDDEKRDKFVEMYAKASEDERGILNQFLTQTTEGQSRIDRMVQGMSGTQVIVDDESKATAERLSNLSKQIQDPFGIERVKLPEPAVQ